MKEKIKHLLETELKNDFQGLEIHNYYEFEKSKSEYSGKVFASNKEFMLKIIFSVSLNLNTIYTYVHEKTKLC